VRTEDLDPAQAKSAQRATGRILDFVIIGVLLMVIAMLVVGRLPFYRQTGELIPQKSVAVLPFENLSGDPDNAYFADGIQEEILTRLAGIADLKVISRSSTQLRPDHRRNSTFRRQWREHGRDRSTSRSKGRDCRRRLRNVTRARGSRLAISSELREKNCPAPRCDPERKLSIFRKKSRHTSVSLTKMAA